MTTNKTRLFRHFAAITFILILSTPLISEEKQWVIGGTRFVYSQGQVQNAVTENISDMLPQAILGKLSNSIKRNIMPDEKFEREKYKLRTERQALYLQISSEYKKRDSLVLSNYSEGKLTSAIKTSEKKIKELQEKIDKNLKDFRESQKKAEEKMAAISLENSDDDEKELSEGELLKNFFQNIFVKEEAMFDEEQIKFYRDNELLFNPSEEVAARAYTDSVYEKAVTGSGINALLTGVITVYGDYLSVAVEVYNYPGSKLIGSALEIGSMDDMDLIATSLAQQLLPGIVNSMPVEMIFTINPPEAQKNLIVYVDDALQKVSEGRLVLHSGVHRIQFISKGYQSAGTTYFFEGNGKYNIDINLTEEKIGYINIGLRKPLEGKVIVNGLNAESSRIAINGKNILGEFVTESGETSFFYVPEKSVYDGSFVTIKPKPMDRMDYIDTRRKWMYGAYTLFMTSLIPTFYTYGNYQNQVDLYKKRLTDYETAKRWQTASSVCQVISIGLGVFWGIELVHYLVAANTVLPEKSKTDSPYGINVYEINNPKQKNDGEEKDENLIQ